MRSSPSHRREPSGRKRARVGPCFPASSPDRQFARRWTFYIARKLKNAGISVDAVRYNGTIHDFVLLNALRHVPSTEAAIDQVNDGLRQHLALVTN